MSKEKCDACCTLVPKNKLEKNNGFAVCIDCIESRKPINKEKQENEKEKVLNEN